MAKYLKVGTDGNPTEEAAITTSAGAGDSGKIPALDAAGRVDNSMMPVGIGADTKTIQASENLSAGDLVNVWDNSGAKARKADASGGIAKKCHGFVLSAVTSGNNATVYFEGTITGLTGLTVGASYFVSTTGAPSLTVPTTSGHIVQNIGVAISTTEISFEPQTPMLRA